MTAEELAAVRGMLRNLRLPLPELPTRRTTPASRGHRVDLRATLRRATGAAGRLAPLAWRQRVRRTPPLVVLCDISGSMDRYARMLLHFLHAITNDRDRVHVLLFGTRLTNITRHLKHRDVDVALARVTTAVADWAGGTRIGSCLDEFNRRWSRRLLGQNAVVLLISDGLDAEGGEGLAAQAERLAKSCRRLVWLNPLLRYEGFEARPAGIKAMLPFVDDFLPVHNLESLTGLAAALDRPPPRGRARATRSNAGAPIMEMTSTRIVPAPVATVWDALNDPVMLTGCISGCEAILPDGENAYRIALAARVGPVAAKFSGRLELADIDPPRGYTLSFDGQGGAAGFAKGEAKRRARACRERCRDGAVVYGDGPGWRQDRADRFAARRRRRTEARRRFLRAILRRRGGEGRRGAGGCRGAAAPPPGSGSSRWH